MITFIVCLLAGLGAGLGTGFAGMAAGGCNQPMLIAFFIWTPLPGNRYRTCQRCPRERSFRLYLWKK